MMYENNLKPHHKDVFVTALIESIILGANFFNAAGNGWLVGGSFINL